MTFFSPYTVLPGTRFNVTRASSLPRAMKTPKYLQKQICYTFFHINTPRDLKGKYIFDTKTTMLFYENKNVVGTTACGS